jgi:hypothetical protein
MGGAKPGHAQRGPQFPRIGKVLHVPARRSVKDGTLPPRGADFPILGRFRLAEQRAEVFPMVATSLSFVAAASRQTLSPTARVEIWPRRGGIAERCNAKGRNRRKAKPNAKHTAPPAREPYPAKTRSGNFRRRRVEVAPARNQMFAGTEELGPEKTLVRYSGLGFSSGSALE